MKAIWKNEILAESGDTIVIEGNHYFPPDSLKQEFFKESEQTTNCPWKGEAHYYNVVVGDEINENAAWYYPVPKDGSVEKVGADFANYVAFWNGVVVE